MNPAPRPQPSHAEHGELRESIREVRDELRQLRELVTHQGVEPERRKLDVHRVQAELRLLRADVERHRQQLYGSEGGLVGRTAKLETVGAVHRGQLAIIGTAAGGTAVLASLVIQVLPLPF